MLFAGLGAWQPLNANNDFHLISPDRKERWGEGRGRKVGGMDSEVEGWLRGRSGEDCIREVEGRGGRERRYCEGGWREVEKGG